MPPKQNPQPDNGLNTPNITAPAPRGRGRPRKRPLPDHIEDAATPKKQSKRNITGDQQEQTPAPLPIYVINAQFEKHCDQMLHNLDKPAERLPPAPWNSTTLRSINADEFRTIYFAWHPHGHADFDRDIDRWLGYRERGTRISPNCALGGLVRRGVFTVRLSDQTALGSAEMPPGVGDPAASWGEPAGVGRSADGGWELVGSANAGGAVAYAAETAEGTVAETAHGAAGSTEETAGGVIPPALETVDNMGNMAATIFDIVTPAQQVEERRVRFQSPSTDLFNQEMEISDAEYETLFNQLIDYDKAR